MKINEKIRLEYNLTKRECEVLELIINEGLNNTEIGKKLNLSSCTTKFYVSSLLRKTESKNRINLVVKIISLEKN